LTRDIYVSDADVEMSRDVESLRIDRHLVTDLSAVMPGRRRKMLDRLEEHGRKNPLSIVPLLLKHYNADQPKVRQQVRDSLARLTQSEAGELALVECVFSRNRTISEAAAKVLEGRNYNSMNVLSTYRTVRNLVSQAHKADVFCKDIEELVVDSIDAYKEGRFDQAITNMMMARDLLDDRLEWHSHLRSYIKDVLKLTPALSRGGVQVDSIQDSIRNLATAVQTREYTDARMLLDLRRQEDRLWKQLWSLEEYITKRIRARPIAEFAVLQEPDRQLLHAFMDAAKSVDECIQDGRQVEALRQVEEFVRNDVSAGYLAREGKRLDSNDEAAGYTMWSVGLGLLRLVAPVIPNVAEEFYQQYYRDREGSPSIHTVEWPGPLVDLDKSRAREQKTPARKRSTTKSSK
jgi:hypothetical protein